MFVHGSSVEWGHASQFISCDRSPLRELWRIDDRSDGIRGTNRTVPGMRCINDGARTSAPRRGRRPVVCALCDSNPFASCAVVACRGARHFGFAGGAAYHRNVQHGNRITRSRHPGGCRLAGILAVRQGNRHLGTNFAVANRGKGHFRGLVAVVSGRLSPAAAATAKRQEKQNLIPDLFLRHALNDRQDIVDGCADRLLLLR